MFLDLIGTNFVLTLLLPIRTIVSLPSSSFSASVFRLPELTSIYSRNKENKKNKKQQEATRSNKKQQEATKERINERHNKNNDNNGFGSFQVFKRCDSGCQLRIIFLLPLKSGQKEKGKEANTRMFISSLTR